MYRPLFPADTEDMSVCSTSSVPNTARDAFAPPSGTARLVHWVVEARSHRIICLIAGIWLLNAFDLMFTILAHQQGLLQEENPLARYMLRHGTLPLILFKSGLVMIGSYPLLRFRRARITELGSYVILVAYAFLAVHWSTCYDLYASGIAHDVNYADVEVPAHVTQ